MKLLPFFIFLTLVIGCSDINPVKPTEDYYKGKVAVLLEDSTSIEDVNNLLSSFDYISIDRINSFQYYSDFPIDSAQTILLAFESKQYLQNTTTDVVNINGQSKLLIDFWLTNFTSEDIQDWSKTKTRFKLTHNPHYGQIGTLGVEEGQEKEWVNILSNSKLFKVVELDYIYYTH